MKEYIRPEAEIISLMAKESIMTEEEENALGGTLDLTSNPFNQ